MTIGSAAQHPSDCQIEGPGSPQHRDISRHDVVIVGAGHAGAQAAIALRQVGFSGSIALVGDEAHLPYERPPLSKDYLAGDKPFDRILIRPPAFWADKRITLLNGECVVSIDPDIQSVTTASGSVIGYGALIWAAGGAARRLTCDGHDLPGVHTVRTRADVDRIVAQLDATDRVVVIGGGFIGLEAAAVLTKLGKSVTIVEAQDRVLARVAGEPLSRFYEAEHRAHGVDVRLAALVDRIDGDGCVSGARLIGGEVLPCDMVIVGIGIVPATAPLAAAGAATDNGVIVDSGCRTSLPNIYAIGDCALHANPFGNGSSIRVESVQNASDQATVVARILSGSDAHYDAVPWFWSNQYDLRLQTIGLSTDHDAVVVRGNPADRSFSIVYLRGGVVIALDCVNAVKDYVQGKALVVGRLSPSMSDLANPALPIQAMAEACRAAA